MKDKKIKTKEKIENDLRTMAEYISTFIKVREDYYENYGFALILFNYDAPGVGHYVSSAERDSMIKALRHLATILEENKDMPVNNTIMH